MLREAGAGVATALAARADSSWPPVLTFLVVAVGIAVVIGITVVFRRLRSAARADDWRIEEERRR